MSRSAVAGWRSGPRIGEGFGGEGGLTEAGVSPGSGLPGRREKSRRRRLRRKAPRSPPLGPTGRSSWEAAALARVLPDPTRCPWHPGGLLGKLREPHSLNSGL